MFNRQSIQGLVKLISPAVAPFVCLVAIFAATPTGCWQFPGQGSASAGLETFDSPAAFKQYLAEQVSTSQSRTWNWPSPDGVTSFAPPSVGDPMPGASPDVGAAPSEGDYSTTNIQESGVDESDKVKNDATHLYVLGDQGLQIVRAVPADDMAVLSSVELPGTPESLYLKGDKAVALSISYQDSVPLTTVTVLNISDRASPVLEATVELEGSLKSSRLIGSKLHLILGFSPTLPPYRDEMSIPNAEFDDLIPDVSITIHAGPFRWQFERNLVEWDEFYRPSDPDGFGVVAVVTLDVDSLFTPIQSAGVMADASTVYASTKALYLTDGETDPDTGLNRSTTEIYKFDLGGDGAVLVGTGAIPGRLLNRFSLGEHEGYLRAATTNGHVFRGGGDAINGVYILGPEDGRLAVVGKLEGIAPGEQIHSARFIGDRGFLVTFKKIDPLFTLDLSDPTSPRVVGELKVPGYSEYIHPLGENHLLTIGKDAVDAGDFAWFQGVQLSIFDVTDFGAPQRVDAEVIGDRGTGSEALGDPHAFNYFEPAQMLAVPMMIAEGAGKEPSSFGSPTFKGLCLFRVDAEDGIEFAGRIQTESVQGSGYYSSNGWTRGIFMDDHVYAVTSVLVQAVPLADPNVEPVQLPLP